MRSVCKRTFAPTSLVPALLLSAVLSTIAPLAAADSVTFSIAGDSVYAAGQSLGQAELRILQTFPLTVVTRSTVEFSATYSQTPLACESVLNLCVQSLNTSAYTSNLAFNSYPDKGICNVLTSAAFPCSATFAPGTYQLTLFINDTRYTDAYFTSLVMPFSDSLSLRASGDAVSGAPEPATTIPVLAAILALLCSGLKNAQNEPDWLPLRCRGSGLYATVGALATLRPSESLCTRL